jgi:sugar lactone lactonase YvrE
VELETVQHLCGTPCTVGLGECRRSGIFVCEPARASCDVAPAPSEDELCDGLDNNCDGIIDNAPGCVLTLAGSSPGNLDGTRTDARFAFPRGMERDALGNIYVADYYNHAIRKITPGGQVTTIAGGNRACEFLDGVGQAAKLCSPYDVAVAADGTVYFSDHGSNRIRMVDVNGVVATLIGVSGTAYAAGSAMPASVPVQTARVSAPTGLKLLPNGDLLFADYGHHRIGLYVAGQGRVVTLAGDGGPGVSTAYPEADRSALLINYPGDVDIDSTGTLYISERGAHRIRKLPPSDAGISITLAGSDAGASGNADGIAARLSTPDALILDDAEGLVYFADTANGRIRTIPMNGGAVTTVVAGGAGFDAFRNGLATAASFTTLGSFLRTSTGGFLVSDLNHAIRSVSDAGASGLWSTRTVNDFVGASGWETIKDGPGPQARLRNGAGLAFDPRTGDVYWTEVYSEVLRRLTADGGVVETLVGASSGAGYVNSSDLDGGSADFARLWNPFDVAIGPDGRAYIADNANHAIRVYDPATRTIETFAGAPPPAAVGNPVDGGTLTQTRFNGPRALAFGKDEAGTEYLYVADTLNRVVQRIRLPNGPVDILAGTVGVSGTDDGKPGRFTLIDGITADDAGNVWASDTNRPGDSCRVRRITSDGTVSTLSALISPQYTCSLSVAYDGNRLLLGRSSTLYAIPLPDGPTVELVYRGNGTPFDGPSGTALFSPPVAGRAGFDIERLTVTPDRVIFYDDLGLRIRQIWK